MKNVLCCSGLDPTGGAGLQADIEAIAALDAHALVVATALTAQTTHNVEHSVAVDAALLERQLEVLLADCPIAAIKVGLLGSIEQLPVIETLLAAQGCAVVLDPVLRAGGGRALLDADFAHQLATRLFRHCTVITPNAAEARRLSGREALDAAGATLLALGARHVLITGGDEPGETVSNFWFHANGMQRFEMPRIAGAFHGAGCTLAAAIAALLAQGQSIEQALAEAQRYVAHTLRESIVVGQGRRVPGRLRAQAPF